MYQYLEETPWLGLSTAGAWVQALVDELKSRKPQGAAKTKKCL